MRFSIVVITIFVFIISPVHALDVSPDGPRLVELPEDASSVIVGNPSHATVALDNPRLMIISAGVPGVTKLTVLGKSGRVIFNERLIVNGARGGYIRIKNACINGGDVCQKTKMYHCENGEACHSIAVNDPAVSGGEQSGDGGSPDATLEGGEE